MEKCTGNNMLELTILHTNDSHGQVNPIDIGFPDISAQLRWCKKRKPAYHKLGGFSYLASMVNKIRKKEPFHLLLDAGDIFGDSMLASLTNGEIQIELMNLLNYDAATIGNHDFDHGKEELAKRVKEADFPIIAANLLEKNTKLPFLGKPYVLKEINQLMVGLYGLTYHLTNETTPKKNIKGLEFTLNFEKINRDITEMKEKGADIIVIISHLGDLVDEKLAKNVDQIDVIIGGHSHEPVAARKVNNTIITRATPYFTSLGYLKLRICDKRIIGYDGKLLPVIPGKLRPYLKAKSVIKKYSKKFYYLLHHPIGYSLNSITRNYKKESPIDTLIGNILRETTQSQISILPGRGYGTTIHRGIITMENLYNFIPHHSSIYKVFLKGVDIVSALKQSISNQYNPDVTSRVGGLIQVTGLSFAYSVSEFHEPIITNVQVAGFPIEVERYYTVVMNQLMFEGGHKYRTLKNAKIVQKYSFDELNVVTDWFKFYSPVLINAEGWSTPMTIEDIFKSKKKCFPN